LFFRWIVETLEQNMARGKLESCLIHFSLRMLV